MKAPEDFISLECSLKKNEFENASTNEEEKEDAKKEETKRGIWS